MTTREEHRLKTKEEFPDDLVICGCVSLTLGDLRDFASRGVRFDELYSRTGAGGVCTSCVLDLEYFYEKIPVSDSGRRLRQAGIEPARSLKRRVYDWLDSLSPMVPFVRRQFGPVLHGPGLEQWIGVANHKLLFQDEFKPPVAKVVVSVLNGGGHLLARMTESVAVGESLHLNLTELSRGGIRHGAAPDGTVDGLSIGSFEITCRWLKPGVRGTTRPQIILNGAKGSDSVHTVGPSSKPEHWIACLNRPDAQRIFVSLVNAWKRETIATVSYPFNVKGCEPEMHELVLPPRGARLHEVNLSRDQAAVVGSQPFNVSIRCHGRKNVHLVSASPALDRLSIDHI